MEIKSQWCRQECWGSGQGWNNGGKEKRADFGCVVEVEVLGLTNGEGVGNKGPDRDQ